MSSLKYQLIQSKQLSIFEFAYYAMIDISMKTKSTRALTFTNETPQLWIPSFARKKIYK